MSRINYAYLIVTLLFRNVINISYQLVVVNFVKSRLDHTGITILVFRCEYIMLDSRKSVGIMEANYEFIQKFS